MSIKLTLCLVVLLTCSAAFGVDDFSGNLMIKAKKKGIFYFCSAVAVGKKLLLTAAHCLDTADEILVFQGKKTIKT